MKKIIFGFLMLVSNVLIWGQEEVESIKVLHYNTGKEVLLRWAPTSPSAWLKANNYGYSIERYTVKINGQLQDKPEKKLLNDGQIILPKPLKQWEEIAVENDYAAILAQAIYGEGFSVESDNSSEDALMKIINQSREIEQRFAFGLFAADLNFEAAQMGGIGFVDKAIEPDEEYFYKIISNIPKEIKDVKSGGVLVNPSKIIELPAPIDLYIIARDKTASLSWDYSLFENLYVAYFIERSETGEVYKKINKQPLVNMNTDERRLVKKMLYVDTLPQNNKKYYYRVRGITSFGKESPPSEAKTAVGFKKLKAVPHIDSYKILKSGAAKIKWSFSEDSEKEISGFQLNRSDENRGKYEAIIKNISVKKREVIVEKLEPSNYFTISAIGSNNQKTTSLTAFVQPIDSIPPSPPVGLEAVIDSSGVVKLKWNPNLEKDLNGYRVFRAQTKTEEYTQLTISPIQQENFVDTVKIKSLNGNVYYKVVALDQRFNNSDYSKALEVKKPDVIPPSSPIFKSYLINDDYVKLEWINSSSEDVVNHQLFRKKLNESSSDWELVYKELIAKSDNSYLDKKIEGKTKYRYAIFAEDTSGLISEPSSPLTITTKAKSDKEIIKSFRAYSDRENKYIDISWVLANKSREVTIYKSKGEETPKLYKQWFNVNVKSLKDLKINPGNNYKYTLKVKDVFDNIESKKINIIY